MESKIFWKLLKTKLFFRNQVKTFSALFNTFFFNSVLPVPAVSGYSVSHDDENSTSLKCCSMASEIFMRGMQPCVCLCILTSTSIRRQVFKISLFLCASDLGWDSWVIYPISLTVVQCALCNLEVNTVQCPSSDINVQDSQVLHTHLHSFIAHFSHNANTSIWKLPSVRCMRSTYLSKNLEWNISKLKCQQYSLCSRMISVIIGL